MSRADLRPWIDGGSGKLTLDQVIEQPFWTVAVVFAAALVVLMIGLEIWQPFRNKLGANVDGDTVWAADFSHSGQLENTRKLQIRLLPVWLFLSCFDSGLSHIGHARQENSLQHRVQFV